jgi:Ni,Fe-hydrogenase III large subunit
MFAALRAIEQKLEVLRSSLVELAGLQATQVGLSAITSRVTEIQEAVESGLEMSELAVEDSNRLSYVRD